MLDEPKTWEFRKVVLVPGPLVPQGAKEALRKQEAAPGWDAGSPTPPAFSSVLYDGIC